MRLLYLGSTDFPQPKARAIQIVNTCHALARAGVEVTLVVGQRGRQAPERGLAGYGLEPHPRLRLIAVPIARIPPGAPPRVLRWFTRVWQVSYLLGVAAALPRELVGRRPDWVYARDLRTARLAAGGAHRSGARLGFEVHGLPSLEVRLGAARADLPPTAAGRLRRLEAEVFVRADRIVTITECARQILLKDYGVPEDRVRTVPDASGQGVLAGARFRPRPAPAVGVVSPSPSGEAAGTRATRGQRGQVHGEQPLPAVYYVGQLYPWKGAGLLVDAAALVPRARFVVLGGLPGGAAADPHVAALAARARTLGVADRIAFRGYVPYARVAEELALAAIAVLPLPDEPVARWFTSPLKLFDYMAAGVPIVASDLPALREILRHGENALLVSPDDPAALAEALTRLLDDPPHARSLAATARRDARAYTWDARAARLFEFLAAEGRSDPGTLAEVRGVALDDQALEDGSHIATGELGTDG